MKIKRLKLSSNFIVSTIIINIILFNITPIITISTNLNRIQTQNTIQIKNQNSNNLSNTNTKRNLKTASIESFRAIHYDGKTSSGSNSSQKSDFSLDVSNEIFGVKTLDISKFIPDYTTFDSDINIYKISYSFIDNCNVTFDKSLNKVIIPLKNIFPPTMTSYSMIITLDKNQRDSEYVGVLLVKYCKEHITKLNQNLNNLKKYAEEYLNNKEKEKSISSSISSDTGSDKSSKDQVQSSVNSLNKEINDLNVQKTELNNQLNKLLSDDAKNAKTLTETKKDRINAEAEAKTNSSKVANLEAEKNKLIEEKKKLESQLPPPTETNNILNKLNELQEGLDKKKLDLADARTKQDAVQDKVNKLKTESINAEAKANVISSIAGASASKDEGNADNCFSDVCKKNRAAAVDEIAMNKTCLALKKTLEDNRKEITEKDKLITIKSNQLKALLADKGTAYSSHQTDKEKVKEETQKIIDDVGKCFNFRANFLPAAKTLLQNDKSDYVNFIMSLKPNHEGYNLFDRLFTTKNPNPCNSYKEELKKKRKSDKTAKKEAKKKRRIGFNSNSNIINNGNVNSNNIINNKK